jgi:hypothetical protein
MLPPCYHLVTTFFSLFFNDVTSVTTFCKKKDLKMFADKKADPVLNSAQGKTRDHIAKLDLFLFT